MALENGYIKIYRKIINWRWYKQPLTKHLFEHLLIIANLNDYEFEKIIIHRGECISSIRHLAEDTGMSIKQVRTALNHLKETQEVAQTTYPKFTVFTIQNYNYYQTGAHVGASKGHSKDTAGASKGQQYKKNKEEYKKEKESARASANASAGIELPPEALSRRF